MDEKEDQAAPPKAEDAEAKAKRIAEIQEQINELIEEREKLKG